MIKIAKGAAHRNIMSKKNEKIVAKALNNEM
jgi:hypothetical protein